MPACKCDAWVSAAFARVFGDPETGDVERCPECVDAKSDLFSRGGRL